MASALIKIRRLTFEIIVYSTQATDIQLALAENLPQNSELNSALVVFFSVTGLPEQIRYSWWQLDMGLY